MTVMIFTLIIVVLDYNCYKITQLTASDRSETMLLKFSTVGKIKIHITNALSYHNFLMTSMTVPMTNNHSPPENLR